jgi:hypothetical protein
MPALLNAMSSRPYSATARSTIAATCDSSATSQATPIAVPPSRTIRCASFAANGEIGHRLGRNVLPELATVARPDTILAWYRKLVARKFDGSKARGRMAVTSRLCAAHFYGLR